MSTRWGRPVVLSLAVLVPACCANERAAGVGGAVNALELACADTPADQAGDLLAILSSTEPVDPSQPQSYGSEHCAGVVFEFDNPEEEALRGAWVQASGGSVDPAACVARTIDVDYWGFKDRAWSWLASATHFAKFDAERSHCQLDALIEHDGTFEKLRVIARVTDGKNTYPMYACVW